jgi:hypothetical protein
MDELPRQQQLQIRSSPHTRGQVSPMFARFFDRVDSLDE